jgi:hypothetical protein
MGTDKVVFKNQCDQCNQWLLSLVGGGKLELKLVLLCQNIRLNCASAVLNKKR